MEMGPALTFLNFDDGPAVDGIIERNRRGRSGVAEDSQSLISRYLCGSVTLPDRGGAVAAFIRLVLDSRRPPEVLSRVVGFPSVPVRGLVSRARALTMERGAYEDMDADGFAVA